LRGYRRERIWTGENAPNNVLIDLDAERQGDLLRDARTAPGWISILHLDNGFNQFLPGSLRSRLTSALGLEKQAIFSVLRRLMEAQESRRFQNDG